MHYEISDIQALLTKDEIASVLTKNIVTNRMLEAVSVESVLKLIEVYGGRRLYVPAKPNSSHALVTLLGQEQANAFSFAFGGLDRMSIPFGYELQNFTKKKDILQHLDKGLTQFEVGKKFHICVRRVTYIVAESKGKKGSVPLTASLVSPNVKPKADWASALGL